MLMRNRRPPPPCLFICHGLCCPKSSWGCVALCQAAQVAWGPIVVSERSDNDREPIPVRMVATRLEDPNKLALLHQVALRSLSLMSMKQNLLLRSSSLKKSCLSAHCTLLLNELSIMHGGRQLHSYRRRARY
jgi:hypothetical protein